MLPSGPRYRETSGSAGPLSQSTALSDLAFQLPPIKLLATGGQVGVRNLTERSPQLGHPLFRRGAVLPDRRFSPCFCHNFILSPIPKLPHPAHVAEDGGPGGIAAGGGVGVFFQRERNVHAGPRDQFAGAAGEVPGLEG